MALVWNGYALPALAMGIAAAVGAAVVYYARPWSPRNRFLALAFAVETAVLFFGLSISTTDAGEAYTLKWIWAAILAVGPWPYLLFVSTFETPLVRPLRSNLVRGFLLGLMVGMPAVAVLLPPAFLGGTVPTWYALHYVTPGPMVPILLSVGGVGMLFALAAAVSAFRRAPPASVRRKQMAAFVSAFAVRDGYIGLLFLAYPFLRFRIEAWYVVGIPVAGLVAYALLAYGMLRHQLLDVRVRARRLARAGGDERLSAYRSALEGLAPADDREKAEDLLASLRRTLRITEAEHAEAAAAVAREDLRHRVERRGRFRVLREIGRGGHGRALLAQDLDLDRLVVLKEPLVGPQRGEARERFLAEARAAARIRHPNVIAVHAVLADEDPPLLVLEHVDGGSLRDLLEREGPLAPARAAAIAADVLRGLARLHAEGIVHRDLSPANVLLDASGTARIADFGVATREAAVAPAGTPGFVAPEVARGLPHDARCDVWSVGALLHAALTGRLPRASTTPDILVPGSALARPPAMPPSPLAAVAERALQEAPAHRYPDAAAMLTDLERATSRTPATAAAGG